MTKESRKPWVGGNWKCNCTVSTASSLVEQLNSAEFDATAVDVVIFPPFLHIDAAKAKLNGQKYKVGSQNCSPFKNGAYTGEISAEMIKDFGLYGTLVGHSERRQFFHDNEEFLKAKLNLALDASLNITFCIGETLEQRQSGQTNDVCFKQLKPLIDSDIPDSNVVIAYEPVWAIGTGKVATPLEAQKTHQDIRNFLKAKLGDEFAKKVRIVYGGSVNEKNCEDLFQQNDIDGFLVGGASLKPEFLKIISSTIA